MRDIQKRAIIFGFNVKRARNRRMLTQTDLGKLIGISRAFMCEIELGQKRANVFLAQDIAKTLKTTLYSLLSE